MARLLEEEWVTDASLGMNDSSSATSYRPNEFALLLNYRVTPDGQAEVRYGSQKTHTSALNSGAQGYGGAPFRTAAGVVQWCIFVGDKFYTSTDEGVTWTEQATSLRTDYWSLVTMRVGTTNYLLCANGGTSSYKWSGSAWSAISNIDANVKFLAVHNDRLWSYATGVTVKASKIADLETWATPDGLSLRVQTHEGDNDLTGIFSLGPILLCFKRASTSYVDGFGSSDIVVGAGAKGIARDVGLVAFRSFTPVGSGGAIWLSERGFEFFQVGSQPQLISGQLETFMRQIAWSDIEATPGLPQGMFYARKLTYECALPGAGTQNNYTFVYRLPTQGKPGAPSLFTHGTLSGYTFYVDTDGYLNFQTDATLSQGRTDGGYFTVVSGSTPGLFGEITVNGYLGLLSNTHDSAVLIAADRGEETQAPIAIGYDGFVRLHDYGQNDDAASDGSGGVAVAAKLRPRPMVFKDPFRRKHGRVIQVLASNTQASDMTVALIADGSPGADQTVTLNAASGGASQRVRANVSGRGRTLQAEVRTSAAGLKVSAVSVAAVLLAERP